jgi:hypothetical protein
VSWVSEHGSMPRTEGRPNNQRGHSCEEDEALLVEVVCRALVLGMP